MKKHLLATVFTSCLAIFGCAALFAADGAGKGFRFPGGDPEAGREAFAALNCIQCHTVAKAEVPEPKGPRRIELNLGGQIRFESMNPGRRVHLRVPVSGSLD